MYADYNKKKHLVRIVNLFNIDPNKIDVEILKNVVMRGSIMQLLFAPTLHNVISFFA